ncbi:efflux RND transporter periplasmic adaptor subunit [Enterobacter mori]|uniref:efflux RND transporter periplasmic adaptor subunit n=1 Tax=Enterobacter mori TaxID=539813 RepID=UPI003B842235
MTIQHFNRHRMSIAFFVLIYVTPVLADVPERSELNPFQLALRGNDILLETLKLQPLRGEFRAIATIQQDPRQSVVLYSRVNGWVASASVLPGEEVNKGDTLAILDGISLREADAALKQAQAAYIAAKELLARKKKLSDEEMIPRNELTSATLSYRQALADLDAARALLNIYGMSGTSKTVSVKAPFSGTVISTTVKRGQTVTPADPLFTLSDLSSVLITASVPESRIRYLSPGSSVRIEASSWPEMSVSAPGRTS